MEEIWKDIKEFKGTYQISNLGNVRRIYKNGIIEGKLLKTFKNNSGYVTAPLTVNYIQKNRLVHRLVADAFIPKIKGKNEVNHIDENKNNNCVNNLEWCNKQENNNYGTRRERISKSLIEHWKNRSG